MQILRFSTCQILREINFGKFMYNVKVGNTALLQLKLLQSSSEISPAT